MASTLTIRKFDDTLKARLRLQAAQHGQSMEQEARDILRRALHPPAEAGLAQRIQARFAGLGADELPVPPRRPARLPTAATAVAAHESAPPAYPDERSAAEARRRERDGPAGLADGSAPSGPADARP
jgi:plasmid stability protein